MTKIEPDRHREPATVEVKDFLLLSFISSGCSLADVATHFWSDLSHQFAVPYASHLWKHPLSHPQKCALLLNHH